MTSALALFDDPLPPALAERLDALLAAAQSPAVLGYHARIYQAMMSAILGDRVRHLIATDAGGSIVGYLPFRERSGPAGRVLCALPFFGPNGLIHVAEGAPSSLPARLIEGFREAAEGALSAVLYTPFLAPVEPIAAAFRGDDRIDKFTQYLDLAGFERWPPKRRADIGRAVAAGLAVRSATRADFPKLLELYRAGAEAAGIPPKPMAYLEAMLELALRTPDVARWTVAERAADGTLAGCLLTIQGPLTMSYLLPAASSEERSNQPVPLLIDESVSFGRARGLRLWNMESSPRWNDPVFKFKERWGAQIGRYAILIAYPRGRAAAEAIAESELRSAYPFYFVRPFGGIGGALPPEA
jgi:hypothetical protein